MNNLRKKKYLLFVTLSIRTENPNIKFLLIIATQILMNYIIMYVPVMCIIKYGPDMVFGTAFTIICLMFLNICAWITIRKLFDSCEEIENENENKKENENENNVLYL